MTESLRTQQLRTAIDTAQSVVADFGDHELRGIAFGKVLEHLLATTRLSPALPTPPSAAHPSKRRANDATRDGPTAWVEALRVEDFFSTQKTLADITEAVCARGHAVDSKNVTEPLEKLVKSGVLKRQRKATEGQKRGVWMYVNA